MTVNVTDTVGANNTIVLDSNSKIPAIDGSQVTALDADVFTTGSLATARIDVGTTAGKILQLDGSARIPALSGTNLTNVPGPTQSTSDPAIDTNSTLGKKWINKTSGEVYICTDATTDENVWTNVGAGTGDVQPYTYQGTQYGYSFGGTYPTNDDIQRYSYTSDGNSTNIGDRGRNEESYTSSSSPTHGYVMGGHMVDNIDKFSFSAGAGLTATDIGNLTQAKRWLAGCSSDGYGWAVGGSTTNTGGGETNRIDRISHTTDGDATDWADLYVASRFGSSSSSTDYGYKAGSSWPHTVDISRFVFATQTNGTDVGDLAIAAGAPGGTSSTTHGYTLGAGESPLGDYIQKFAFASSSNASDVANLLGNLWEMSCSSSTTYGYTAQGSPGSGGASTNTIQKHSFSSDTNATDVGDTTVAANYCGLGCQF